MIVQMMRMRGKGVLSIKVVALLRRAKILRYAQNDIVQDQSRGIGIIANVDLRMHSG